MASMPPGLGTPGITVRPIVLADGDPETCEVFWDDVRVPVTNRLVEPGLVGRWR